MIFEFSPFFEENVVAGIKFEENSGWVDQFHVTEANRTFKYNSKELVFGHADNPRVRYHTIDADSVFTGRTLHLKKAPPFIGKRYFSSVNEQRQRDFPTIGFLPNARDILIFSDIDEIIDSRRADELVDQTYKHGIVNR